MAIIIETCPKCGHDLRSEVICTYPPIHREVCYNCGWSWEGEREEVVRIPFQFPSIITDDIIDICNNVTEEEIQEYLASTLNDIKTTSVNYAKNAILG